MTIHNIGELKKIIELCRKSGVVSIKIDNVEMLINEKRIETPRRSLSMDFPEANIQVPQPNLSPDMIKSVADKIATDELTPEQLMFYSATGQVEQ